MCIRDRYVTGEQLLRQDAAEDARAGRQTGADSVQREVARRFDAVSYTHLPRRIGPYGVRRKNFCKQK